MLSPKQSRFVDEYLIDISATQAAIRAGYSQKTAGVQGAQLLANPKVKAAIDAAKRARSERTQINSDFILARLVEEANADLADLFDKAGDIKPIEQWPEIWRQGLVAGVESEALFEGVGKDRIQIGLVKKIKLSDRVRRLELIGKHIKVNAFQETVNHTGLESLGDRLDRAKARLETESKQHDKIISLQPAKASRAVATKTPPESLPLDNRNS